MPYGIRYRIAYKRKGGGVTTIDIRDKSYDSDSITTLIASGTPLTIINEGDANDIYVPVIGSGAVIKVYATPLTLRPLFTNDPQKFKVQIYHGNSGTTLVWQGFVNSEIYSESYSTPVVLKNEVTINCNDGIKILEDILYKYTTVEESDTFYLDTSSWGQIIDRILGKLALTFTYVYTSNDIFPSSTVTNMFNSLEMANENFIDESDEAMTCREVLESIIGSIPLQFRFIGGNIYLIDPVNLIADSKGKRYGVGTWGETSSVLGGSYNISAGEIDWYETGQELDILPAISSAEINYNPYNFYNDIYEFADKDNWLTNGVFTIQSGYELNTTISYKDWVFTAGAENYMQIAMRDDYLYKDPEFCLWLDDRGGVATYEWWRSNVRQDDLIMLRISIEAYINTDYDSPNIYSTGDSPGIQAVDIPIRIKVGDQYWHGADNWDLTAGAPQALTVIQSGQYEWDYANSQIANSWNIGSVDVMLKPSVEGTLLEGAISVSIIDNLRLWVNQIKKTDPSAQPAFNKDSTSKSISIVDSGVSVVRIVDYIIRVTIVGWKTYVGVPTGEIVSNYTDEQGLVQKAIASIFATSNQGSVVGGYYYDTSNQRIGFGSDFAHTVITVVSYTPATDTVEFDCTTTEGNYFGAGFSYIDTCYLTLISFNYYYDKGLVFIKSVKCEIILQDNRENIDNEGIKRTGKINTNLNGRSKIQREVTTGIGPYGSSKGAIKSIVNGNANAISLYRGYYHESMDFLLQAYLSQYSVPRSMIRGKLNVAGKYPDIYFKLLRDTIFLPGVYMFLINSTYHDREEYVDGVFLEIASSRQAIM